MRTWGYIINSTLAKLDLTKDEASATDLTNRFAIYANEAMTQICSTIKPNRTFVTFIVYKDEEQLREILTKNGYTEEQILDVIATNPYPNIDNIMPDDFVSFGDDVCSYKCLNKQDNKDYECHDTDILYRGYNKIQFLHEGIFTISYNARWFTFDIDMDDNVQLNVPDDILDCLPSYIASQCYKVDDEVKSSIYRNEYEMFVARIDATDYKNTKTFSVGGGW